MTDATVLAWLPAIGALVLVASPRPWRGRRPVVDIAHQGGHVARGLLAGLPLARWRGRADPPAAHPRRGREGRARRGGAAPAGSARRGAALAGSPAPADRLVRATPGAFQPYQYGNQANPAAHEATTGPEIWAQTDGRVDSVAAFREAFIGRLQAMARAHGLLLDARWRSADLETLVAAIQAAGLVEALSAEWPFTVFAPTEAAFAALPDGTLESLLQPENRAQLEAILTYHVVAGRLTAADVVGSDELVTLYRRVATHLSVVRSASPDPALVGRLSALVARARSAVTGSRRGPTPSA